MAIFIGRYSRTSRVFTVMFWRPRGAMARFFELLFESGNLVCEIRILDDFLVDVSGQYLSVFISSFQLILMFLFS
jgi:hypothetical protein